MKAYIQQLTLFILCLAVLSGCYKDKGNYDYITLDEVIIDTSQAGLQSTYAIARYDVLKIAPRLIINKEVITDPAVLSTDYTYNWSIYQTITGGTIHTRDTISSKFVLDTIVSKPAGNWNLLLTVKNNRTKIETYQKFTLTITEAITDGWMVLYEKDGHTDVGLIVDERSQLGATSTRVFTDLIKNTNGASLLGKPMALLHSAAVLNSREVVVASEHDVQAFGYTDFSRIFTFEDLFDEVPATRSVKAFTTSNARKEVIINDNKVHIADFTIGNALSRTISFGTSLFGHHGELEAWNPKYVGQGYDAVVYDKTNKRFLYSVAGSVSLTAIPSQTSAASEWDPNNVGLDLKAFDYGLPNTPLASEYLVMNSTSDTYLLTANFTGAASAFAQKKYNITSAPEISAIGAMASSSTGAYILYGANNNVYAHRYQIGQSEKVWSAPAGEKITSIRFLKFYHTAINTIKLTPLGGNDYVYIATYDEASKTGKVYNLKIDRTNGLIQQSTQKVYEGFGKIKDMSYKWVL